MSDKSENQQQLERLLKSLDGDSAQTAAVIIETALMSASATASAKRKETSKSDLRKIFTGDVQRQYDELMKKLNTDEQKVFQTAVEQARINGALPPEVYDAAKA